MTNWVQIFGKLLIAIALIVVPFSMSHASMGIQSPDVHQSHMMKHDSHVTMDHGDLHQVKKDTDSQPSKTNHEGHDTANCCSSICGGALAIEFNHSACLPIARLKLAYVEASPEPGEWVPPFRPPST